MNNVIHCDLKPENILFKSSNNLELKIIDFGSGCFENKSVYTYIQSRFYRSPEVMLGIPYTSAIDMWSLGCILVELYLGRPVFPAKDEEDLMSRIVEVIGAPPSQVMIKASRKAFFFDSSGTPFMKPDAKGKIREVGGRPLNSIIDDPDFSNFLELCLSWDPDERLTPEQALKHIWVTSA